mmetsp:Transcript_15092/g.30538  ORF Transcript_15092/g.30538 Transcript_15092/m.30538 type:complete len:178 (-) Transcript_15092:340-873(-)
MELMNQLMQEFCTFDRYERVARDMKKFILGRRIVAHIILLDVWNLYTNDEKPHVAASEFNEIFECYMKAVANAIIEWIENVVMFSLRCVDLEVSESSSIILLETIRDEIHEEAETVRDAWPCSKQLCENVWLELTKYSKNSVVSYEVFSKKFLPSAESSWGKDELWKRVARILVDKM